MINLYHFKVYLLMLSCSFSFSVYPSEILIPTKYIDFNSDLSFVRKTLLENHPAIGNALDAPFLEEMEKNFNIAEQKLLATDSADEKVTILQEFGRSFHDAHLWIHYNYDLNKAATPIVSDTIDPFSVENLKEDVYWITIATFHPSKDQINHLNSIIELLPQLREQTVVFDLRGNGGGNSFWAEELLKALFGEEYVNQQLAKSNRNVYTQWRISSGNVDHVKRLVSTIKKEFGRNHSATAWIKNVYKGMKDAFLQGENYYSEPPYLYQYDLSSNATNLFSGHIIVIIDKGCYSACLMFIDDLKAMNADVVFIGEPTGVDSLYGDLRTVGLPSGKGTVGFPIKVWRNRPRGHNVPHIPDIPYKDNLKNTVELQNFVLAQLH